MSNNWMKSELARKAKDVCEYQVPDDLDEDQKIRWNHFVKITDSDMGSAIDCGARVFATNPNLFDEFMELHRKATLKNASYDLAKCPVILGSEPEFVQKLLRIPVSELTGIIRMASRMDKYPSTITLSELKEVMDSASVVSVMEEEGDEDEDVSIAKRY